MTDRLIELLGNKNVTDSPDELKRYAVAGRAPSWVLFPATNEQVAEILKLARRDGKKVLISGNNSQRHFGSQIEAFHWCISLRQMNHIIEHDAADLIVTVQSGVTSAQLQKFLNQKNQFLPLDPIGAKDRTLGGIVASNCAGALRLRYGAIRDLVLGMTVVLGDGTIIRAGGKTVKNVAGYDLSKLFIGSMGTLGVITSITFRLFPLPAHSRTLWVEFDQLIGMAKLLRELASSNLLISRCKFLNATFIDRSELDLISCQAPQGLLINVHGPSELVESTIAKLKQLAINLEGKNFQSWEGAEETRLWDKMDVRALEKNESKFRVDCEIATPKSSIIAFIEAVQQYGRSNRLEFPIAAQAGNGIIYVFCDEDDDSRLRSHIASLRQLAYRYQGNLIVKRMVNRSEHPIDVPPDLIWGAPGSNLSLMKRIKAEYDPEGIFAAGRFIGGL